MTEAEILIIVRSLLLTIMELDEDEIEIEMVTRFQDDLELESIEMIALGDALRERITHLTPNKQIDFARWLTQLSIEELMELSVADLVTWIHRELHLT